MFKSPTSYFGGDSRTLPESAHASRRETRRVWQGFIEQGLVPFGSSSPLAGPVIAHRPCKVLGLGPRHDGEAHHCSHRFATPSAVDSRYANFSPVTDAIGRIRRCQRSTCVTAAIPAPRQGMETQEQRSLSRLEVVRAAFGSPRLSQDEGSIAKNRRVCARRFQMKRLTCRRQLRTDVVFPHLRLSAYDQGQMSGARQHPRPTPILASCS